MCQNGNRLWHQSLFRSADVFNSKTSAMKEAVSSLTVVYKLLLLPQTSTLNRVGMEYWTNDPVVKKITALYSEHSYHSLVMLH